MAVQSTTLSAKPVRCPHLWCRRMLGTEHYTPEHYVDHVRAYHRDLREPAWACSCSGWPGGSWIPASEWEARQVFEGVARSCGRGHFPCAFCVRYEKSAAAVREHMKHGHWMCETCVTDWGDKKGLKRHQRKEGHCYCGSCEEFLEGPRDLDEHRGKCGGSEEKEDGEGDGRSGIEWEEDEGGESKQNNGVRGEKRRTGSGGRQERKLFLKRNLKQASR